MDLDGLLLEMINREASDCHLKEDRPPLFRIDGELLPTEFAPVTGDELRESMQAVMDPRLWQRFEEEMDADFAHSIEGQGRFRCNIFRQRGHMGAVIRHIPLTIPRIEKLGLPAVLKDLVQKPQGLILVTGPTGSGKTTTLAAMIQHINATRACHIVTIEDPIEFVYSDEQATINQRQLGADTPNLKEALRRVLRQDPDVILMGEMRDKETIEMALHGAETGHLVFSTLHTNDAKQSVDRMIDSFPQDAHKQLFKVISLSMLAVISQRLCKRADGHGRIAAMEIMINSPQIRVLLEEGKTYDIEKAIATSGSYYRMQTFNQALAKHVLAKTITEEEALSAATNPGDLRLMIKGVVSGSATATATAGAAASVQGDTGKIKISRGF